MPLKYLIINALIPVNKLIIFGWGWDNSCGSGPISKNELPNLSEILNNSLQVTCPFYNNYMLAVRIAAVSVL